MRSLGDQHIRFVIFSLCVRPGLLVLVLVGAHAATGHAGPPGGVPVAGYCEAFARAFCGQRALAYQEHSARTAKRSDVMLHLSNLFQPPDSTFTAGYACQFQARTRDGRAQKFSVGLYLTKTLHFARYTQWPELQLIPIAYVTDATGDRAGYGVFKYLETP